MSSLTPSRLASVLVLGGLALLAPTLVSAASNPILVPGLPVAPAVSFAQRNNTHLLVWAEDRGTGTGLDIYALRLAASGLRAGAEVPVIVAPGNQSDPSLVFSNRLNEFLMVYTDDAGAAQPGPTPGGPGGATPPIPPIPGPTTIPLPTLGPTATPGPTVTPGLPPVPFISAAGIDAQIDAAALRARAAGLSGGVIGRVEGQELIEDARMGRPAITLDGSGGMSVDAPLSAVDGSAADFAPDQPPIPGTPGATPGGPAATPTPGGPGVPVPPVASGSRDIHGIFLSTYGFRISNSFALVSAPSDDTFPDLALLETASTDQYVLLWREVNGVDVTLSSMRMRGIGRYLVLDFKRTIAQGPEVSRASVAADPTTGQYLVVWAETPATEVARDIYGRLLNVNAAPYRNAFTVVGGAPDQVYPAVASLGSNGGYIIAWEERDGANPPDIKTRQLNRNGYPYRPQYALAGGPAFSFAPNISDSSFFKTLVVWLDRNPAGDHSIMTVEVNRSGYAVGQERVAVQGGSGPAGNVTPIVPGPGFPTPPVPIPPLPTP